MKLLIALFLSLIFFWCFESTMANNIDSLRMELNSSTNPKDSLLILKELTKYYESTSIDSSFYYGQIAIAQAGKLNDTASLANVYNYLGTACFYSAFYEKALEYDQKSKELFQLLNDETGLVKIYNNIGIIYEVSGKNDIALEHYNKSLDIWRRINEHSPDDPETKKIIANLYNNLGIVNYNLGEKEKALEFYNKSLTISRKFKEKKSMSLSLHNIGIVHIRAGNYNEALNYLFQSHKISNETNDKHGIANSLNNIGDVYLKLKNYKKAGKHFNEGLQIAGKIQANELIKNAYQGLYLLNKETGKSDTAMRYQTLYHQLNDSIYSLESKNRIAELQHKYEFEKKEQEITLLKVEQEIKDIRLRNSRIWLFILIGSITISLFFIGLIYFQMIQKKRANKQLVKKNLEIVKSEEYIRKCLLLEQENRHPIKKQNIENKYATSSLTKEQKEDLKLLIIKTMENEKLYLKNDFTIDMLSKHLDVSRTYISQVINEKFNINFNTFINEYRVKDVRRMLTDKANRNLTIETIALSVGFGSKSSFNSAFKKYTGITPSFFMKSSI